MDKCTECGKTEWSGQSITRILVPFEGRDVCPNCYRDLTHTATEDDLPLGEIVRTDAPDFNE